MTDIAKLTAESLAELFHATYERLAPEFGYRTREASAVPWVEVPEPNRRLMVATCAEILAAIRADALRWTDIANTGPQTPEAALEILARELYVRREDRGDRVAREAWYRHLSPAQQDIYRRHATRFRDSLAASGLALDWMPTPASALDQVAAAGEQLAALRAGAAAAHVDLDVPPRDDDWKPASAAFLDGDEVNP